MPSAKNNAVSADVAALMSQVQELIAENKTLREQQQPKKDAAGFVRMVTPKAGGEPFASVRLKAAAVAEMAVDAEGYLNVVGFKRTDKKGQTFFKCEESKPRKS